MFKHPKVFISLQFQLCYNAQGVYCQPLVIHDGRISQNVVQQYSDKMDFIQTVHGALSFNCVGQCVCYINEYVLSSMYVAEQWTWQSLCHIMYFII